MVSALREAFIAEPLTFDSEHVSSPGPIADAHHHPGQVAWAHEDGNYSLQKYETNN